MSNKYWIIDEWLIFKPSFNEDLTNYYDVINKYKKIIFSNYNDPLITIKTNNKYKSNYENNYVENNFNKEIDLSNNINLTHLTFGYAFNQEIDLSNNINLTHLNFGYYFNNKIDLSNNINLIYLIFECYFNQEINLSNNINLTHLIFKCNITKEIDLSNNINLTHLTFGWNFNQEINLSNNINLTHLTFVWWFNQELNLSNNINLTHLTFGYYFNQEIDLSNNINLTHLTFGYYFNQEINLSNNINLIHLTFGYKFNQELNLLFNINLKKVLIDIQNNEIENTNNLLKIITNGNFEKKINIPLNVKYLKTSYVENYLMDNLSNNIEELTIYNNNNKNIDNLPNSIKKIIISNSYTDLNNLPNSIEELILFKNVVKINKIPKNLKKIYVEKIKINSTEMIVSEIINIINDISIKNENNKLKYHIKENINEKYNEKYNDTLFTINKNLNNLFSNININELLKETNSVISGSFITWCIGKKNFEYQDIDIFTHNEEKLLNNIPSQNNKLVDIDIISSYFNTKLNNYIKKIYNLDDGEIKIQIIVLKEEVKIKEAIEQFDLSCCKLFYDGEKLGSCNNNDLIKSINDVINYETTYNCVHIENEEFLTCRIIKDMERIQKYINRDFSITNLNEDYYNKMKILLINSLIKNYFGQKNLKNEKLFNIFKKNLNF